MGYFLAAYYLRLKQSSYDFTRNINPEVKGLRRYDLKYNSYYISGYSENNIFLGNYTTPGSLLKMSNDLRDTQYIKIDITNLDPKIQGNYKTIVDSNQFFIYNGTARAIYQGSMDDKIAKSSFVFVPFFQEFIPIHNQSFVFRYINENTNMNSIRKNSYKKKSIENQQLLEKQVDGLFCTSGLMEYSKDLNQLTYTYLYRNEILIIDTNLNLVKKLKTIDPIDSAKFKVSTIKSDSSSVITSPSLLVNAKSSVWKNYLFVESRLMGKHEDDAKFKSSVVLDIYDLKKSKYLYSLYLPKQDKGNITQFKIINKYIYTLSDNYINRYEVPLP